MSQHLVLFQGSFGSTKHPNRCSNAEREFGCEIALHLGRAIIEQGMGIILNGHIPPNLQIGENAVKTCNRIGVDPHQKIRTYPYGGDTKGFGMVITPASKRWQDARTFSVNECNAAIGIAGGKGTADVLQKCVLAGKPVFPIAVICGDSKKEWERLRRERKGNREYGDLDFLADVSLSAEDIANRIASECSRLLNAPKRSFSKRVFIVHGHDSAIKNELARLLERLGLDPVILHEQPDSGRFIFQKLQDELSDVGFGFIIMTPDDSAASVQSPDVTHNRARQNVIFEHGMLIGSLGNDRVCAIVKGDIELPSDLHGIVYKHIPGTKGIDSISLDIVKELKAAGYKIDANKAICG